jgi:hypothetical protein
MSDSIPTGSFNKPDPDEKMAEHILGATITNTPDTYIMNSKASNQGGSVHCTTYGTYHVGQILNEIEHSNEIASFPEKGWTLQQEFGTYNNKGDYVQTALKSIVKNGLQTVGGKVYPFTGYAQVKKEEINSWLAKGYPVVTSSPVTKTNFVKARDGGIFGGIDGEIVAGHAFAIIGYKPGYKVALNSYGSTWGKFGNGTFLIEDKDVTDLETCYILYDAKDLDYLFNDVTSESWAYEAVKFLKDNKIVKGYPDGNFLPNNPITRAECSQMIFNAIKFLNK